MVPGEIEIINNVLYFNERDRADNNQRALLHRSDKRVSRRRVRIRKLMDIYNLQRRTLFVRVIQKRRESLVNWFT